jgi:hypothetical protein
LRHALATASRPRSGVGPAKKMASSARKDVNAAWSRAFIVAAKARSVSATCFFSSSGDGRAALAIASISMLMPMTPIDSRRIAPPFIVVCKDDDLTSLTFWHGNTVCTRRLRDIRKRSIYYP